MWGKLREGAGELRPDAGQQRRLIRTKHGGKGEEQGRGGEPKH